mmetsp:Transcript_20319/g.36936  ORF Transcript_20319/g.36936 Transcript_20319/m.36936 type:complete len:904 (-) Transcript_20319:33-2744(-)
MGSDVRNLEVFVEKDGDMRPISPWGSHMRIDNEFYEGSMFFVHRPPQSQPRTFDYEWLLGARGDPPPAWELQLQGRFKVEPVSPVFLAFELWDGPMRLGFVTRTLCRAILRFAAVLAKNRGIDLGHSLGEKPGEVPMFAVPYLGADRVYVSDEPVPLPLKGDSRQGAWKQPQGGSKCETEWPSVSKSDIPMNTKQYVTTLWATSRLDWSNWSAEGIPGLGSLDLEQFWGIQPAHILIYDQGGPGGRRRTFFHMKLSSFLGAAAPHVLPSPRHSLSPPATDEPSSQYGSHVSLPRPSVGSNVAISGSRRQGVLVIDDRSDLPFKVQFTDGRVPAADWFREGAVEAVTDEEELVQSTVEFINGTDTKSMHSEDALCTKASGGFDCTPINGRRLALDHVDVPWYFRSGDGSLWWCMSLHREHARWIEHHRIMELLEDSAPEVLASISTDMTLETLEEIRRALQISALNGRLSYAAVQSLHSERLHTLLRTASSTPAAEPWEQGAVVEQDGCITFHPIMLEPEHLLWYCRERGEPVLLELKETVMRIGDFAGAPALFLSTVDWEHILLADDVHTIRRWETQLQAAGDRRPIHTPSSWCRLPLRWDSHRHVLNATRLCLAPCPLDALSLSAALLREALLAQQNPGVLKQFIPKTSALKGVCLSELTPQELWCFWVNVYHCLLIHAREVRGMPVGLRRTVSFYNSSSYIVAGHVFSLTEIEHRILRRQSSKPVLRPGVLLLRTRELSEEDLTRKPTLAAPFSPSDAYMCQPDWRLNLVLSAGNLSSSDRVPVFERCTKEVLDQLVEVAMKRTLSIAGGMQTMQNGSSGANSTLELPYTLFRYNGDAPGKMLERAEARWARLIFQHIASVDNSTKVTFARRYFWTMRESLARIQCGQHCDNLVGTGSLTS